MDKFAPKKIILPGRASQRISRRIEAPSEEETRPVKLGRDYVIEYQKKHEEIYMQSSRINQPEEANRDNRSHCSLSEIDSMTLGTNTSYIEESSQIYKKFDFNVQHNTNLLIYGEKERILNSIEAQRIVIIKGATGCGKTTQVPQFILESACDKGAYCKIVVTQPRRLAAVSVAKRVATERKCEVGTLVGYQIGQDRKSNDDTKIMYVTTGILLEKLIKDKEMREFTHYIVDEIHERDQDMDFLLLIIRHLLNTKSKHAKLIVMSATMDVDVFWEYLKTYYNETPYNPITVEIKERTQFKVHKFFLDNLVQGKNKIVEAASLIPFEPETPTILPNAYKTATRIIQALDHCDTLAGMCKKKAAVLVFLPGLYEIEQMEKVLREMSTELQQKSFWIKPLHSSITAEEQQQVFNDPPESKRKIILSTNIAESSVTVSDIEYVIDFCLTKVLVTDPTTNCTSLELAWASKNSLTQRAGRVGRVKEGRVYRMITESFYETHLEQDAVPEILRSPLENLVLKAKLLDIGSPEEVLALAMEHPDLKNIHQAVALLKEMGALLMCADNKYVESNGDLTFLGRTIARLPLNVRLGKLIFLGIVFGVPEECIIMACAMSIKNMFSTPYGKHLDAYNQKLTWADSSCSDPIAFLNAYKEWRKQLAEGNIRGIQLKKWARDCYLQENVLRELSVLEEDIKNRLKNANLYSKKMNSSKLHPSDRPFFLKLAIAGAFYPNYFFRGSQGGDEKEAVNVLGGHDPFSTVFLTGLPQNHPTEIYKKTIRKLFKNITDRLDVNMDHSSKAYVTFKSPIKPECRGIPGKIEMNVYRALKMRQANMKFLIPKLKPEEAERVYREYLNESRNNGNSEIFQRMLENLRWPWRKDGAQFHQNVLDVIVGYVETPQKFWILNASKVAVNILRTILNAINTEKNLISLSETANLTLGSLYVTAYNSGAGESYYRCRIVSKKLRKLELGYTYDVFLVDFGETIYDITASSICDVRSQTKMEYCTDKLPDFAVECSLAKIKPKVNHNSMKNSNEWSKEACKMMKRFFEDQYTVAKVYSVVNDVLRVKLVLPEFKDKDYHFQNTINHLLLKNHFAETFLEDYVSVLSRQERKAFDKVNEGQLERSIFDIRNPRIVVSTFDNIELSTNQDYKSEIILNGPFSPLEMKLASATRATSGKLVRIEKDSVNSILLDTDPSDPKERMLVSAFVGTNPTRDRLSLKQTTMMPNLPALPMLCCLVFAPMVELRYNPTFTAFSGALCGLGYDKETKKSYLPENDIEIVFDHEIDDEKLIMVNKVRYWLSVAFEPKEKTLEEARAALLDDLLKPLFLPEPPKHFELQPMYYPMHSHQWGLTNIRNLRDPCPGTSLVKHPAQDFIIIYRLIWAASVKSIEEEKKANLQNIEQLKQFADGHLSLKTMDCALCSKTLKNAAEAKLHMKMALHRKRLQRYLRDISDVKSEKMSVKSYNTNTSMDIG